MRLQPFDPHFVHIDVIVNVVAPGLCVVGDECAPPGLVDWLRSLDLELLEVSYRDVMELGANVMSLGDGQGALHRRRDGPERAAARARAHGLRPRPVAVHDGRRRARTAWRSRCGGS